MMSPEEVEFNKLSTQFCSKIIKAILDVGTQNLDLGDEMLEKMNVELATLSEKQKEHEECTSKMLEEVKKLSKSSVVNLTSKVLTNSFDKNSVKQRIDAFKEELKALVDHSDDIENRYFAIQENISLVKSKVLNLNAMVEEEKHLLRVQQEEEAEAERLRQEEAERKRQEEAERKRKKEAEAERLRQEEAERKRLEEAEAERQRQKEAEAERQRQKKAEAERKRQKEVEAERKRQKEVEAERKRQKEAEAERQRQEEAKAERQRQKEAQALRRRQKEAEAERLRQEQEEEAEAERQRQEEAKAERQRQKEAQAERQRQQKESQALRQRQQKGANKRQRDKSFDTDRTPKKVAALESSFESTPSPPKKAVTIPILKKAATVSTPKKAATAIISAPNKAVTMATPKMAVVDESTSESYTPTPRKSVVTQKSPLASIQLKSPVVSTPNKFAAPPVPPAPKTATKSIPNPPELNKTIDTDYDDASFWDD